MPLVATLTWRPLSLTARGLEDPASEILGKDLARIFRGSPVFGRDGGVAVVAV